MSKPSEYPDWFLWFWEKGPTAFVVLGLVLLAILLGGAYYFDSRLGVIESRLQYVPPQSYQPPNLDEYQPEDVLWKDLPIKQWEYVPAYSHIYFEGGAPYPLETTLSIRNVDRENPLYVNFVGYYDTTGKLVRTFVDHLIELKPLQTIEFLVERGDSTGGSGANFLVEWATHAGTNKPLIESVMVGNAATHGISFSRTGIAISSPSTPQSSPE